MAGQRHRELVEAIENRLLSMPVEDGAPVVEQVLHVRDAGTGGPGSCGASSGKRVRMRRARRSASGSGGKR